MKKQKSQVKISQKNTCHACEHCIDCFFRESDGGMELCFLDPNNPVEINYFDKACSHFELSDSAAAERRKAPGEL